MVKNFFKGTPFECQINFKNGKCLWLIEFNKFYEEGVFMNSICLGDFCFFWKLPKKGRDF